MPPKFLILLGLITLLIRCKKTEAPIVQECRVAYTNTIVLHERDKIWLHSCQIHDFYLANPTFMGDSSQVVLFVTMAGNWIELKPKVKVKFVEYTIWWNGDVFGWPEIHLTTH